MTTETAVQDAPTQQQDADSGRLVALETENKRLSSIVSLTPEERAYFDALPDDMRSFFLGKSTPERGVEIAEKRAGDEVVYRTADGIDIRKSAGEVVLSLAKSNDALRQEAQTLRAEREHEAFVKRADAELAHLPGDVQSRAALLKAVEGIPDEAQRTTALAAIKSQSGVGASAFTTIGAAGGSVVADDTPDAKLQALAKRIAADEKIDYHQAYAKGLMSTEGRALYAKSVQETTNGRS